MSDDLLLALGRAQREDLDREVEGDPARSDPDTDELSRPFDAGERAALLDSVFERLEAEAEPEPETDDDHRDAESFEPEPATEAGGEVVELAPRRRGVLIGSLLAVAAAAAVLLWWTGPGSKPEGEQVATATIPAYAFTDMRGGVAEQRSAPPDPAAAPVPELKLRADSNIDWVLTPAEPTREPIAVALLARSEAGERRFVPRLEVPVSGEGAIRLRGPLSRHVALEPGVWSLTLLVAEPEALPKDADALDWDMDLDTGGDADGGAGPWRSLSLRVIIVADE